MSNGKKDDADQQQFWQMALETFKSSGLSVRQFCKQEGLAEPSFYIWRKKFSQETVTERLVSDLSNDKQSFIEVNIPAASPAPLILEFSGGGKLRIPPNFDTQTLTQFLQIASELGLC